MNELTQKFKEVLMSVLPITFIVLILNFTVCPLGKDLIYAFLIGSAMVIIGLTIFLFGIDLGIEPIGHRAGNVVTNSNSYAVAITFSLILGFFISFAEPDLHILAKQVDDVTSGQVDKLFIVSVVSIGIGIMMTVAMLRILKSISIKYIFTSTYLLIFVISIFSGSDFLAIAFDSSGATTGAITVPFMLALAAGISAMKKDSKAGEVDNFGIIGIASTGAILGVLISGLFLNDNKLSGNLVLAVSENDNLLNAYISKLPGIALNSFLTLLPIIATYALMQIFVLKQKKKTVINITKGLLLTFLGLVFFLLGINGGFMEVGARIGIKLASRDSAFLMLTAALLLGITTVLAEPAVHVLTNQIEKVTGGFVKRKLVLIFLSIGVGFSIFISSLRIIITGMQLWMILLPGFGIAVIMSFLIPDLFVGIAIDAGGVASGPMTATFSLSFIQGIAYQIPTADVVTEGFGMIAIVAMMPIIAIELLGMLYQIKLKKAGISYDEHS